MPRIKLSRRRTLLFSTLAIVAGIVTISACSTEENPPAGSVALALSPTTVNIAPGGSSTAAATITRSGSFTGAVTLTASGSPTGVTVTFDPDVIPGAATTATVEISVGAAVTPGDKTITINAAGTGVTTATATLTVTVVSGENGAILLGADPNVLTANVGGAAVTSVITVTRTAPFAGAVALTVTGVPSGVTATVSPASVTAATATLSVQASSGAVNGLYPLVIHGAGTGVANATATVNVTVAGGSAQGASFTFNPNPLPITAGGAAGTSVVTVTRNGGFIGSLNLTITGAPAGMTATVAPNPNLNTATSTITVQATAAVAAATYNLTLTGTASGIPNAVGTLPVVVTGGGGGGGNVSFTFCAENAPLWVATQSGNGSWAQVTPTGTTYQFTFTSATGGLAVVEEDSPGEFDLTVFYATFAEFSGVGGSLASSGCGTNTVNGLVAGLGATQTSTVFLGPADTTVNAPPASQNFVLKNVPEVSLDLVAILNDPPFAVNKIILRPGLTQANNSNIPVLDFASQGFPPNTANNVTVANLGSDDAIILSQYWGSNGATTAGIGSILGYTAPVAYNAIPVAELPAGALQSLSTSAFNAADPTHSRFAGVYFRTPAAKTITLGPDLSAPTSVTKVVSGANSWPRIQLPSQTEYNKLLLASFTQGSLDRIATVSATAGYYGAAPATWDLALPVLNGVTGWQETWGLQNGTGIDWTVLAQGGTAQIISPITDGSTFQWAGRSSSTPLTLRGLRTKGGADPFGVQRRLQATLVTTGVR